jgi:hypothetical protein
VRIVLVEIKFPESSKSTVSSFPKQKHTYTLFTYKTYPFLVGSYDTLIFFYLKLSNK